MHHHGKRQEEEEVDEDEEEEEEEHIDCTCGMTGDTPGAHQYDGLWLQCDECLSWLHGACVGYPKRAPKGQNPGPSNWWHTYHASIVHQTALFTTTSIHRTPDGRLMITSAELATRLNQYPICTLVYCQGKTKQHPGHTGHLQSRP